jgi:hypothetical protein
MALLNASISGMDENDFSCSGTVPSWSQTPEFDNFVHSQSYNMMADVHQLKDKLFCMEKPGFAVGNFPGEA